MRSNYGIYGNPSKENTAPAPTQQPAVRQVFKLLTNNYLIFYIKVYVSFVYLFNFIKPPPQNVGGPYWIRFVPSVGRSVRPSVSISCLLYNSFTNGRISFKLEWHIHLN